VKVGFEVLKPTERKRRPPHTGAYLLNVSCTV